MRNLDIFPRDKWRKKSWESLNLYAQIAHKLGLYSIKSELEDIALKYLEPQDYAHIHDKLAESEAERKAFIAGFIRPIEEALRQNDIKYHIKSRTKSIFSIWTKMRKQRSFITTAVRICIISNGQSGPFLTAQSALQKWSHGTVESPFGQRTIL